MSQKTNKPTKAIKEINKYINFFEKEGKTDYSEGIVWGMKKAQEIIKNNK